MTEPTLTETEERLTYLDAAADHPLDGLTYGDLDLVTSYGEQGGHPQPKESDD